MSDQEYYEGVLGLSAQCVKWVRQVAAERDDLRAILAPLLDEPMRRVGESRPDYEDETERCVFCGARYDNAWGEPTNPDPAYRFVSTPLVETTPHAPTCPVLRKDALLGRQLP